MSDGVIKTITEKLDGAEGGILKAGESIWGPIIAAMIGSYSALEGAKEERAGYSEAARIAAEQQQRGAELQDQYLRDALAAQERARMQGTEAIQQGLSGAQQAITQGSTNTAQTIQDALANAEQQQRSATAAAMGELTPGYQQAREQVGGTYDQAAQTLSDAQAQALQQQQTGFQQGQQALSSGIQQQQGQLNQSLAQALGFGAGEREAGAQGLDYLRSALGSENPLLALRAKQEEEDINRALAARGLLNSGAAIEALSEASQKRNAEEAARQVSLAQLLANYGQPANQQAAQLTTGTGSQAAQAIGQGQAGIADLASQQGQVLANTGLQGAQALANLQTQRGANLGNLSTQEAQQRSALQAALGSGLAQGQLGVGQQLAGIEDARSLNLANLIQQAGSNQANLSQGFGTQAANLQAGVGANQAASLGALGSALGGYASEAGKAQGSALAGIGAGIGQLGQSIYQGGVMKDIYGGMQQQAPASQPSLASYLYQQPQQQNPYSTIGLKLPY